MYSPMDEDCDDGNPADDLCVDGECTGGQTVCDDGIGTVDGCDDSGECTFAPDDSLCGDGNECAV